MTARPSPPVAAGPTARGYLLATASLAIAWAALVAWLSARRYAGYNAGMLDLGNMSQAIASVLRGQPLVFTFVDGQTSRLALHVELFYYLLAPLWAVWPDPRALLIAQALLYAAGAIPAYRLGARAAAAPYGGLCLALIYLLYPVAQTAVLFDLHGDTLAMPLLLFALEAMERRAWLPFALWAALAISCKFYVAAPVGLAGLVAWRAYGARRAGLITFFAALAYGLVAFLVIRPLFTTASTSAAHSGLNYLSFYFGQLDELAATAVERLLSAAVVFGPALLLAWGGRRWLLPALPMAVAALLSTGPGGSYDYRYHHYAVVVPFVIMAAAEGVAMARQRAEAGKGRRPWRVDLVFTTLTVALCGALLADTPLNPLFWLSPPGSGLDSSAYGVTGRDAVKNAFLDEHVPEGASLAASTFLASHLVERDVLYLVRYPDDPGGERLPGLLPEANDVLLDALFDWRVVEGDLVLGGAPYERAELALLMGDPAFGLVAADDGLLLFQRAAAMPLGQSARALPAPPADPPIGEFGPVRLHRAELTALGGRRYRASFVWSLASPVPASGLVAVSRLEGVPDARIVHLPTYGLLPVEGWAQGQAVEESFEFVLPARVAPGTYRLSVAWYDLAHPEAYATDERSRVGAEFVAAVIVVP